MSVTADKIKLPADYNALSPYWRRQVREQYVRLQNGNCCHCGKPLNKKPQDVMNENPPVNRSLFPVGFFKWPVHLHHNHTTGATIGAVHCYCNAVLWQYHGE